MNFLHILGYTYLSVVTCSFLVHVGVWNYTIRNRYSLVDTYSDETSEEVTAKFLKATAEMEKLPSSIIYPVLFLSAAMHPLVIPLNIVFSFFNRSC